MLHTATWSPRKRHLCKVCRPSRHSHSSYGSRRKLFMSLVNNRWIRSKNQHRQHGSASRPLLRTHVGAEPMCYKGGQTQTYRLIKNNIRLALEATSSQRMEREKDFSMRMSRYLTTCATCIEWPGLPVERDN